MHAAQLEEALQGVSLLMGWPELLLTCDTSRFLRSPRARQE